MKKTRKRVSISVIAIALAVLVTSLMPSVDVSAGTFGIKTNFNTRWTENLLQNANLKSGFSYWGYQGNGTFETDDEGDYIEAEYDGGSIGSLYQDVGLGQHEVNLANDGQLLAYANAYMWLDDPGSGALTLLFFNSAGQVYNGSGWVTAPSNLYTDASILYSKSGIATYSAAVKDRDDTNWCGFFLGAPSDYLDTLAEVGSTTVNGYDSSYKYASTYSNHTPQLKVPAGTTKIRYCVSGHTTDDYITMTGFCLRLGDATPIALEGATMTANDGRDINASVKHKVGTELTLTMNFNKYVSSYTGSDIMLGVNGYDGQKMTAHTMSGKSIIYTTTITEDMLNGQTGDDLTLGIRKINSLWVKDNSGYELWYDWEYGTGSDYDSIFGPFNSESGWIRVDNRAPELQGTSTAVVNAGANQVLDVGDKLNITLKFHEPVKVTGNPTITLSNGKTMTAAQTSTLSNTVTFTYTVALGEDMDALQIATEENVKPNESGARMDLSGIVDEVGNDITAGSTYADMKIAYKDFLKDLNIKVDTIKPVVNIPNPTSALKLHVNAQNPSNVTITAYNTASNNSIDAAGVSTISDMYSAWVDSTANLTQDALTTYLTNNKKQVDVQGKVGRNYTIPGMSTDGSYYLWIKAADSTGQFGDWVKSDVPFVFDGTKPTISCSLIPIEGIDKDKGVEITEIKDNVGVVSQTYQWKLGDAIKLTGNISENYEIEYPTDAGCYSLILTAKDEVGNTENVTLNNIYIDNDAPVVTISEMGDTGVYKKSCTFDVGVSDNLIGIKGIYYQWTDTSVTPADGDSAWIEITGDMLAADGMSGNTAITLSEGNGDKFLYVKAVDYLDNTVVENGVCRIDTELPQVELSVNGLTDAVQDMEYTIAISCADNLKLVSAAYAITGSADSEGVDYANVISIANGDRTANCEYIWVPNEETVYIHVKAVDEAGNEMKLVSEPFIPDTEAPTGTLALVAGDAIKLLEEDADTNTKTYITNRNQINLRVSASDATSSGDMEMRLMVNGNPVLDDNQNEWMMYSSFYTLSFDAEGDYEIRVAVRDTSKNEYEMAEIIKVIYDKTPPEIEITYSTTEWTNGSVVATATVTGEGEYIKNGSDTASAQMTYEFTGNGTYTFVACDVAGNESSKEAVVSNIDKIAPVVSLTSEQEEGKAYRQVTVNATAEDVAGSGENGMSGVEAIYYRCLLNGAEDGSEWKVYNVETGIVLPDADGNYADGTYVIQVCAADMAGNFDTVNAVATKTMTLDNTVPTPVLSYAPAKESGRTANNITATIAFVGESATVIDANGQPASDTYVFTDNDNYTFYFVDAAGNRGTVEATVDWIDKSLPVAQFIVKDTAGNPVDANAWVNYDLQVTLEKPASAEFSQITFNGTELAFNGDGTSNIEGITKNLTAENTYIVSTYGQLGYTLKDSETTLEGSGGIELHIDKEAPYCNDDSVVYSMTTPTNQDVTVTITAQDTLSKVSYLVVSDAGEVVSEDGNRHVFTENGSYDFIFVDQAGNRTVKTITVGNIDKEAPIATISYVTADGKSYTTDTWTNQDVKATVTFEDANEVIIVSNNGNPEYIFAANGKTSIIFTDVAGNQAQVELAVDKIDKVAPTGVVTKYVNGVERKNSAWTNQDVVAILTASDDASGTADMEYTFRENGSYEFVLKDNAGNTTVIPCQEEYIDKVVPTISIKYSGTEETAFDVYAYASADENVTWAELQNYKFTQNGEYTFVATDRAGNVAEAKAEVTWIDKSVPEVELVYTETNPTNKNVTVEIKAKNEGDLFYVLNNTGSKYFTFEENGEFTFVYTNIVKDEAVAQQVTAQVTWIDKTAPKLSVTYDNLELTAGTVKATFTADEAVTWPSGMVINEDGSAVYEFKENGKTHVTATDAVGNKTSLIAQVDNIDNTKPVITLDNECILIGLNEVLDYTQGVTVTDDNLSDVPFEVIGEVDNAVIGKYEITYKAVDKAGNVGEAKRTVYVYDKNAFQVICDEQLTEFGRAVVDSTVNTQILNAEGVVSVKILSGIELIGKFKRADYAQTLAYNTDSEGRVNLVLEDIESGYHTIMVQDTERNIKLATIFVE